jgi:hypothetical protein
MLRLMFEVASVGRRDIWDCNGLDAKSASWSFLPLILKELTTRKLIANNSNPTVSRHEYTHLQHSRIRSNPKYERIFVDETMNRPGMDCLLLLPHKLPRCFAVHGHEYGWLELEGLEEWHRQ